MWFLSLVLSSEYRRSFRLPSSMKAMFQETPLVLPLLSTPLQGGHADSLDVIATGSRQLCRLTAQEN